MFGKRAQNAIFVTLLALLVSTLEGQELSISEFLAVNGRGLEDETGERQDWIEVQNTGRTVLDLADWFLTDDPENLTKWQFPEAMTLGPGEFAIVFASGEDRAPEGRRPHTNFRLSGDGEYLALVRSDGTLVQEFAPAFPGQIEDASYGSTHTVGVTKLIGELALPRVFVPMDNSLESEWARLGFNDSVWPDSAACFGYDTEASGPPPQPVNLALSGTASQSSTLFDGDAARAIDGNTDGNYATNSTTHSGNEEGVWWQVDLGDDYALERMAIFGRTDCCGERLSQFRISVLTSEDELAFSNDYFTDGGFPASAQYEFCFPRGDTRSRRSHREDRC